MDLNGLECCGWSELSGLAYIGKNTSFKQKIAELADGNYLDEDQGAILFNQANYRKTGKNNYGEVFAKQIEENGLGTVVKLPPFTNPNHGSQIQAYVWIIDRKAVKAYLKEHKLGQFATKGYW